MISVKLIKKSWLYRSFTVITPAKEYSLEYHGRGFGWEGIAIDGDVVVGKRSIFWWVPQFTFDFGEHIGAVEVHVWPWFTIKSFKLSIDDELLYED